MYVLWFAEENDASNYLDQVDRGGNTGLHQGQIYWCIDNAEHHFTDRKCFVKSILPENPNTDKEWHEKHKFNLTIFLEFPIKCVQL